MSILEIRASANDSHAKSSAQIIFVPFQRCAIRRDDGYETDGVRAMLNWRWNFIFRQILPPSSRAEPFITSRFRDPRDAGSRSAIAEVERISAHHDTPWASLSDRRGRILSARAESSLCAIQPCNLMSKRRELTTPTGNWSIHYET